MARISGAVGWRISAAATFVDAVVGGRFVRLLAGKKKKKTFQKRCRFRCGRRSFILAGGRKDYGVVLIRATGRRGRYGYSISFRGVIGVLDPWNWQAQFSRAEDGGDSKN